MRDDDQWGQARTIAKTRRRRLHIAVAVLAMLALPFLLDSGSRLYLNIGGPMRSSGFPLWLPLSFWAAELAIAVGAAALIFRSSDELQRHALVEGAALAGSLVTLLLPPLFFMGQIFGAYHSDAILGLWAVAVASGALAYRARLKRR